MTPLCTQLTYEGLIDEIFGIYNSPLLPQFISSSSIMIQSFDLGTVDLPQEMVLDSKTKEEKKDSLVPGKKVESLVCDDVCIDSLISFSPPSADQDRVEQQQQALPRYS